MAEEITGQAINAVETDRRPGDAPILIARADKIQDELGWQPRHPNLTDIIASAWNWHKTHPHGYQEDDQQQ
jgi:UDP-glucose 4-epimerase